MENDLTIGIVPSKEGLKVIINFKILIFQVLKLVTKNIVFGWNFGLLRT